MYTDVFGNPIDVDEIRARLDGMDDAALAAHLNEFPQRRAFYADLFTGDAGDNQRLSRIYQSWNQHDTYSSWLQYKQAAIIDNIDPGFFAYIKDGWPDMTQQDRMIAAQYLTNKISEGYGVSTFPVRDISEYDGPPEAQENLGLYDPISQAIYINFNAPEFASVSVSEDADPLEQLLARRKNPASLDEFLQTVAEEAHHAFQGDLAIVAGHIQDAEHVFLAQLHEAETSAEKDIVLARRSEIIAEYINDPAIMGEFGGTANPIVADLLAERALLDTASLFLSNYTEAGYLSPYEPGSSPEGYMSNPVEVDAKIFASTFVTSLMSEQNISKQSLEITYGIARHRADIVLGSAEKGAEFMSTEAPDLHAFAMSLPPKP